MHLNLDEHEVGCMPMTNPCRTCRVVAFLREHLDEVGLAELNRLLRSPKSAPAVVHPSSNFTPEQSAAYTDLLDCNVKDIFPLSGRAEKCLLKKNILTVRQLVSRTEGEMLAIPNFGWRSLNKVKELLAQKGLHFEMEF